LVTAGKGHIAPLYGQRPGPRRLHHVAEHRATASQQRPNRDGRREGGRFPAKPSDKPAFLGRVARLFFNRLSCGARPERGLESTWPLRPVSSPSRRHQQLRLATVGRLGPLRFRWRWHAAFDKAAPQLIDEDTGEVVERHQVAKGYEHSRGQYVLIDDDELKELQVESSKVIDLTRFVDREEVDPVLVQV
jgi:hypothetical protein